MKSVFNIWIICILLLAACGQKKLDSASKKPQPKQPQVNQIRVFDYQPPTPENGELMAVIELGALGLNYFIIEIDNEARWQLRKQTFGRSNIIYGSSTSDQIVDDIKKFKREILAYSVNPNSIYMVASSSALKAEESKLKADLSELSIPLKIVSPQEEAKYALIATIPKEFTDESFLVDVGSGNTKLSWMNAQDTSTIEIHGSKYFLSDVTDTTVFREVRDAVLEIPEENRNLCFMLGGIIYEFAKKDLDNKKERYLVLDAPGTYPTDNEKLKAGDVIYSAIYLQPTYSYIFDSQSNFSIGYLVSLKN